jgi:hypothetical protein
MFAPLIMEVFKKFADRVLQFVFIPPDFVWEVPYKWQSLSPEAGYHSMILRCRSAS